MSRVKRQTAFSNRVGRQLGAMTEAEARSEGWPTEAAPGSTFKFSKWSRYRDAMLERGYDLSLLRPFGWSPTSEVPEDENDSDHDADAVAVRRLKPNDRISESLRKDSILLRKGHISNKDPRWKMYGFSEVSFVLRRGSMSMHIHLVSALAGR